MAWGVFDRGSSIHVAPVDDDGYLVDGHAFGEGCYCHPELDTDPSAKRPIFIHHGEGLGEERKVLA